ncbi:MAG: recombinase family protein [Chitinophagaceae bacterium]
MEFKKQVGIWLRVSTEGQVKDESPEHHERRARLYAESKGWEVVEVYRLEAISGKSVMEQPETKRMLKDIKQGRISGLIFSKLARLARNTKELLDFAEIFREANTDLISLGESIDTSTPAGRLFYTMIAAMATWEREEIVARINASVPIRASLGKSLGGQASFGYKWVGKELMVDEKEAPIRKLVYELFLTHKRKVTVANLLNEQGYRTRNGSNFSDTTISRLLRDSTAKGQRIANYTKSLGEGKNWVIKPQEEWVVTACPAVVSEEVWEKCNDLLDKQEKERKPPTKRPVHLFTSIVYCECGEKMYIPSQSRKYICLTCRKQRIDLNDLEDIYYENLKLYLLNKDQIVFFTEKTEKTILEKEKELVSLRAKKEELDNEMDKLVALYQANELPKEGFGKHYNPLYEQVAQIDAYIPEVLGQIDFLKMQHLNTDQVLQDAISLYESWPGLSIEGKRSVVEEITQKITIAKDGITFKFLYSPAAPFKMTADDQRKLRDSSKPSA